LSGASDGEASPGAPKPFCECGEDPEGEEGGRKDPKKRGFRQGGGGSLGCLNPPGKRDISSSGCRRLKIGEGSHYAPEGESIYGVFDLTRKN